MNTERKNSISGLFDSWAGVKRGEDMARGHDELVADVLEHWNLGPGDHLLDVGCGNGRALTLAKSQGAGHLAGIDVSSGMIDQARKNIGEADLKVGRGEELPWADDTFTHVMSIEAFYYLEDPLQGLREIRRVLKPGGKVAIVIDFYGENEGSHVWQDSFDFDIHLLSENEWKDLMEEAGFSDINISRVMRKKALKSKDHFEPSPFFPTYELYENYMKSGALKLTNLTIW